VNIFKPPKEPSKKALRLDSIDGKTLSNGIRRLSRQNTQGSIATVRSFETTAEPAFGRIQERASGKGIKGLIVEFHDHDGEFSICLLHD
jgi:hypothetical protein